MGNFSILIVTSLISLTSFGQQNLQITCSQSSDGATVISEMLNISDLTKENLQEIEGFLNSDAWIDGYVETVLRTIIDGFEE